MWLLLLSVAVMALWFTIHRLKRAVNELEARMDSAGRTEWALTNEALATLRRRVDALEAAAAARPAGMPAPVAAPSAVPAPASVLFAPAIQEQPVAPAIDEAAAQVIEKPAAAFIEELPATSIEEPAAALVEERAAPFVEEPVLHETAGHDDALVTTPETPWLSVPASVAEERVARALAAREAVIPSSVTADVASPSMRASEAGDAGTSVADPVLDRQDDEAQADGWEVVVGTNWLNKIGVFVFVLGMALLLGYSFTRIGPVGRVALAYVVSVGLLGVGVRLEKQPGFRTYAYGLVAGGWAAIYFTTFAMHGVSAARLIESELVAGLALVAVAGAMIAHSLKYKSETVTAMAYVVAFGTLTLTPLSEFSFVASVPLAASLVIVAHRLGWDRMALLGLVSTYSLFAVREQLFPGAWLDPQSISRYLALGVYWLMFETADIARLRHPSRSAQPVPLFAVNAAALLGATLLQAPEDPALLMNILAATGLGYLASAVTRRLLMPAPTTELAPFSSVPFSAAHGAMALSALLVGWLMHLRFAGGRETMALVVEAEVLLAASFALRDIWVRWMSAAAMAAAAGAASLLALSLGAETRSFPWPMLASTPAVALVAAVLLFNREWLDRRRVDVLEVERAYPWIAFLFVSVLIVRECAPEWRGVAGLGFSMLLLEAGLRQRREYFHQAVLAAAISSAATLQYFLLQPGEAAPLSLVWRVIPAATLLAYGFAARTALQWRLHETDKAAAIAAAAMSAVGTALLALFEWRLAPPPLLSATWAATALALASAGRWRHLAAIRWQGYALALLATTAIWDVLADAESLTRADHVWVLATAALVYATSAVARGVRGQVEETPAIREWDVLAAGVLAAAGTVVIAAWEYRAMRFNTVATAWAATAAALAGVGLWQRREDLRWHGYTLASLAVGIGIFRLAHQPPHGPHDIAMAALTIVLVFVTGPIARAAVRRSLAAEARDLPAERLMASVLEAGATMMFVVFKWQVVSRVWVPAAWAATGGALVAAGYWRGRPEQRWQGYALAGAAAGAVGLPLWQSPPETATTLVVAGCVSATLYAIAGGTRHLSTRPEAREEDAVAVAASTVLATALLVLLEWRALPTGAVAVAWGSTAVVLLALGFWRSAAGDLRVLAYALLALSAGWDLDLMQRGLLAEHVPWAVAEIVLLHAVALGSRHAVRRANEGQITPPEERTRVGLLLAGTLLLTVFIFERATPGLLVPAWGVQGMTLLFGGFVMRERALRLSGLGLLFLCIVRLGYDVRRLDALARIISFVVLGLILLAVSWTYTRFRDQMNKWL